MEYEETPSEPTEFFLSLVDIFEDIGVMKTYVNITDTGADVVTFFSDPDVDTDQQDLIDDAIHAYGHKLLGCDEASTAGDLVDAELHEIIPSDGHDNIFRATLTLTKK